MPTRKLPTYYNEHASILKSKNLPQNLQGNIFKYLSYREAWARIKQALVLTDFVGSINTQDR